MNLASLISPDGFKDMSPDQIIGIVEKLGVNVPEILAGFETGLLNQAQKLFHETGKRVLLVMEPNKTNDQVEVTIYKDMDGYGDLQQYQKVAFRNLLELFKNQPTNQTPNHTPNAEESQTKQIGSAQSGSGISAGNDAAADPGCTGTADPDPGSAASAGTAD